MKDILLMHAKHTERADAEVGALLEKIAIEERNKKGTTYFGSIHDLYRHLAGGVFYFQGLFRASLPESAALLPEIPASETPEGTLDDAAFTLLRKSLARADRMTVELLESLGEADMNKPIALDWYADRKTVPLHFLLGQLYNHGMHHRGQLAQLLDERKIENDFSGIDIAFMSE